MQTANSVKHVSCVHLMLPDCFFNSSLKFCYSEAVYDCYPASIVFKP